MIICSLRLCGGRFFQCILDVAVQRHIVRCGVNNQTFVKLRGNADIKAAFICNFRCPALCFARCQIIINSAMKIIKKFFCGLAFIRDEGAYTHNFTIEEPIFFRKFNAAKVAFVLDCIIHMSPSCSNLYQLFYLIDFQFFLRMRFVKQNCFVLFAYKHNAGTAGVAPI